MKTESIPVQMLEALRKAEREGKFWQMLIELGFIVNRGLFLHDVEHWSLDHTVVKFRISLSIKDQLIVTIIHNGVIATFDGITYEGILGRLKVYLRELLNQQLKKLDEVTLL